MAQKGVRFIGGREFLLAAEKPTRNRQTGNPTRFEPAGRSSASFKRHDFDYMIYVHGSLR